MKIKRYRIYFLSFLMLLSRSLLFGQISDSDGKYIPEVGQKGKDVVWVPTPYELIRAMLSMAGVSRDDYVVDLGSGDGRVVITAAKLGARSVGVEYDHNLYELSLRNAKSEGVSGTAQFVEGDLFGFDLSDATVITLFLLPDLNKKLKPRLLNLKPGTRIVSNTFAMGDWIPDKEIETEENPNGWNTAFLWIVPGRIQGTWKLGNEILSIRQSYQVIHGSFISGDQMYPISEGKITGNTFRFRAGKYIYNGTLGDSLMSGTRSSENGNCEWKAKRTGA
jgi:SAM-dependent methyltransferase